jgi:hypothetical protein
MALSKGLLICCIFLVKLIQIMSIQVLSIIYKQIFNKQIHFISFLTPYLRQQL